jgi:hypothetical protein
MVWTPAELDSQIAQLQRGIERRKREIADMEPRAGWGSGYARALSEKREALAYHERELETIRAQRAEWGKGSAARTKCGATFQSYVPPEEEGGLEWLHNKVDASKEKGRNRWGVPSMGKVTGSFTEAVSVPVEVLAKIPGQRNEQDNVRGASLDYIRANWAKVIAFPPYIEVAYNGEAWVSEGNHRIMVAVERGEKTLPVEIRYFDGGERVKGPLHPQRLCSQSLPVSSRVRSAPVPARGSRADAMRLTAEIQRRADNVWRLADGWIEEEIGEGNIESIWLVGSRGGVVNEAYPEGKHGSAPGMPHAGSDWDWLVVGEDFGRLDVELNELREQGRRGPIYDRRSGNDIIFSSTPPTSGLLAWPVE